MAIFSFLGIEAHDLRGASLHSQTSGARGPNVATAPKNGAEMFSKTSLKWKDEQQKWAKIISKFQFLVFFEYVRKETNCD